MEQSEFVDRIISKYIIDEELRELLITHSQCVARKALEVVNAKELLDRVDLQFLYDAAMLHDIGIVKCNAPSIYCHGSLPYICHGIAGSSILADEGVGEPYRRICERHTGSGVTAAEIVQNSLPLPPRDFIPETLEEKLVCYADKFFSKSGDPRAEKSIERVMASISRHGEQPLARFMALHRLFSTD